MSRDYKREYKLYHSKPEQKRKRAKRNSARAKLKAKGVNVAGKDVDHKKALRSGGGNGSGNLRTRSVSSNRADNGGKGGRPKIKRKK